MPEGAVPASPPPLPPEGGTAPTLAALDALVRQLRELCPWDRAQDERSIVPHTLDEAYEVADAAMAGDDAHLVDELGDLLFQVFFLTLLLEERGVSDLEGVARGLHEKLVRRHPHLYGDAVADTSGEVLVAWDAIKRGETGRKAGMFAEVPELLPALLHARKSQRRAASGGVDPLEALGLAPGEPLPADDTAAFAALGDDLYVLVDAARRRGLDPELALRATTARLRATANPDPSPDQGPA
ncbi:MAG: MazG nucleotide pyrophosphohydrolase domain-containing protein [Solirubrobacteraceae bacterium]